MRNISTLNPLATMKMLIQMKNCLMCIYIADPEPFVQEQAVAFVRNLVDGCIDSVKYAFTDDSLVLKAIGKQLQSTAKVEIRIQVRIFFPL